MRWEAANTLPYVARRGPTTPTSSPTTRTTRRRSPSRWSSTARFDWEGDSPPAHAVEPRRSSTRSHVKGFTKQHPEVREDLRGTYGGLAVRAGDRATSRTSGVTAVELLPIHHIADESFLTERGLTNYWGYSSIGFLAPHAGYAATGATGEQVREFKGMVKALHRAGIEVILDVVYNHTAEGNHLGPMLVVQGRRQPVLLPPRPRRPALLHGLHGHGQLAQRRAPERAAADHGLAALLGHRVPRRRLPLRPGQRAGARALRRRPPVGVLRHDPPGPRPLPGQAHRRAVGRRARRLPGRQLPRAVVGVERHLPRRRCATSGAARRGVGDFAERLAGSSDLYEPDGRAPVRVDQLHHRPRRLHAAPTSSPTTRSTTRPTRRTTATAPTTTARGTAASRARPTTRRSTRCAPASSATS